MSDSNLPPPPGGAPPPPPPPGGTPPPPPPPGGTPPPPPPPPPGGTPPPPPPPPPGGTPPPPPPPPPGGTPPPPGGFGDGGHGVPPQPGAGGFETPRLDLGASLQYGWKKFTENAGGLIVTMLVVGVAAVIIAVIVGLLQAGSTVRFNSSGLITVRPSFLGMIWNVVLQVILTLVIVALASVLLRAVLGVTKGVAISADTLTKTDNIVPYLLTMVAVSVIPAALQSFLGWVSFGLGALVSLLTIVWGIVMGFAPMIALDTGAEPVEALKKSMEWVTKDFGTTGVIVLVAGIVSGIGVLACVVGLFVSVPVGMLALAYTYRARSNELVAA